ncbi:MAG TPA: PQQ-binding-like beta-propeller repeat protein [Ktedonobacteraceae bacterium]|jgi:outer membrane protein assembly factor BamB|nr:PQQ-binding-like beta-propeller repeat protein [Ktedonobacteraceae bacterium]
MHRAYGWIRSHLIWVITLSLIVALLLGSGVWFFIRTNAHSVNGVLVTGPAFVALLDRDTGKQIWRHQTNLNSHQAGINTYQPGTAADAPLVSNGLVYVLTQTEHASNGVSYTEATYTLEALNLANGTLQWSWGWKGRSMWKNPPVLADGVVYLSESTLTGNIASPSAYQGFVVALRASDGHQLWKTSLAGLLSPATVADNAIYLSNGKALLALSTGDGHQIWQYQPADGGMSYYSPLALLEGLAPAIIVQSQVYLETRESDYNVLYDLVALNPQTGRMAWRYRSQGILTTPVLAKNTVYVNVQLNQNLSVVALNTGTGAVVWTYRTSFPRLEHPVLDNGVLYLEEELTPPSGTSDVVALQANNGHVLKRYTPPESFEGLSAFTVGQQALYLTVGLLGTPGAEAVIALNPATGAEVWNTLPIPHLSSGLSVIASQNHVYVVAAQTSPGSSTGSSTLIVFQADSGKQLWSYGTSDQMYAMVTQTP